MLSKKQRVFAYDMGKHIDKMACPLRENDPCIKKGLGNGCIVQTEMFVFDLYNDVVGCQVLPDGYSFSSAQATLLVWSGSQNKELYTFIHSSDFGLMLSSLPDDMLEELFEGLDPEDVGKQETVRSFLRVVK